MFPVGTLKKIVAREGIEAPALGFSILLLMPNYLPKSLQAQ